MLKKTSVANIFIDLGSTTLEIKDYGPGLKKVVLLGVTMEMRIQDALGCQLAFENLQGTAAAWDYIGYQYNHEKKGLFWRELAILQLDYENFKLDMSKRYPTVDCEFFELNHFVFEILYAILVLSNCISCGNNQLALFLDWIYLIP